jgi:hypothetical protein
MLNANNISDRGSLLEVLTEVQRIFSIRRDYRISTGAMTGIYEALEWCSRNFDLNEGTESYIRGNFNAVGGHDWDSPISNIANKKTNEAQKHPDARGGEAEYGLRSLMQILKDGKLKTSEQAMVTALKGYLSDVVEESNGAPRVSH